jgi:hypothetical protein
MFDRRYYQSQCIGPIWQSECSIEDMIDHSALVWSIIIRSIEDMIDHSALV